MICAATPGTFALYHDADGEPIRRPVLAWRTNTELDSAVGLVAFGRSAALRDADDIERDTFLGYELPPAPPPSPTAERRLCDYEDCDQEPAFCVLHYKAEEERIADLRGKLAQAELELREARAENEELRAKLEIAYMPRVGDCVRLVSSPDEQDALVIGHVGTIVEIDPNSVMFRYILDLKGTPGAAGIHADAVFELVDSIAREGD